MKNNVITHYVYLTTCILNNKKYVGKHSTYLPIEDDKYIGSGVLIQKAILKYGKEKFSREILHICKSEEEAYELEMEEIKKRNAVNDPMYYNISSGGDGNYNSKIRYLRHDNIPLFLLNEKKYVIDIINSKRIIHSNWLEHIELITKYLFLKNYNHYEIKTFLNVFFIKYLYLMNITESQLEHYIDRIVNESMIHHYNELLICDSIPVTKFEFDVISKLKSKKLKQLAFTILVLSKYWRLKTGKQIGFLNIPISNIFQLAGISIDKVDRTSLITELFNQGVIILSKDNCECFASFIKDDSLVQYNVVDMRKLGYQYNIFAGYNNKYFTCKKCGVLVKVFKNNDKKGLCRECMDLNYIRTSECIDCCKLYTCSSRAGIKKRCNDCQSKVNQQKKNEWALNHKNMHVIQ